MKKKILWLTRMGDWTYEIWDKEPFYSKGWWRTSKKIPTRKGKLRWVCLDYIKSLGLNTLKLKRGQIAKVTIEVKK